MLFVVSLKESDDQLPQRGVPDVAQLPGEALQRELLGLRWPDIDFDKATMSINRGLVAIGYELHESRGKARPNASPATTRSCTSTVSSFSGISRAFAYALVRRGELPSIHLGQRRVVPVVAPTRLMSPPDQLDDSTIDLRDKEDEEAPTLKATNQ